LSLKHSYALIAPFYDAALAAATRAQRERSLAALPHEPARVLLNGVGTGLDLPHLPPQHTYTGLDLTHAMLRRALPRAAGLDFCCVQGDAQRLPFADGSFDHAILHLILAVVPNPAACLAETARVLTPGGSVLIFDKFLRPRQSAPLRRLINPLLRRVATRLDVVFEEVLGETPSLLLESNQPALASGWFRLIRLKRL
jgi:ubiquinone/menaquinone biosynthesis C-methylase UbiE